MSSILSHDYVPWIIGFAFSVLAGHVMIKLAARQMWVAVGLDPELHEHRPSPWQPEALGLTERALFTASILTGHAEFIAVWVGLKTVSQWSVWGTEVKGRGPDPISGREIYVNFLLGTSLSIAFAAAGAYGKTLLAERRPLPAFLIALAVVCGTAALTLWIRWRGQKYLAKLLAKLPHRRAFEAET